MRFIKIRPVVIAVLAAALAAALSACSIEVEGVADLDKSHFVVKTSAHDFQDTAERLKAAIAARNIRLFAEIDHAAGAASVGMQLRPTTLFIFGTPQTGSPLMTASQAIGLDLPLRVLVYENAHGEVMVQYRDIDNLADEYDVTDRDQNIAQISAALDAITDAAVNGA